MLRLYRMYNILLQRRQIGEKYIDELGTSVESSIKCVKCLFFGIWTSVLESQLSHFPPVWLIQGTSSLWILAFSFIHSFVEPLTMCQELSKVPGIQQNSCSHDGFCEGNVYKLVKGIKHQSYYLAQSKHW